jgi:subtilase family serine protease
MGDDVTLTIIITNLGKAKTASSYVAYYIDGNFKDSISANSIDSGATAKVSFQWKAELGTHRIKAVADFNNVIDESDETNNAKEIDFPGALAPDFVIQDITWDHTQTQGLVYINAIIMNVGGHASAPQVYFYVDGVFYTGIALQSVPGGYEYYIISKANQGTHTVKVVVNPLNSIPESDYTNNSKTVTLTIS